jgi:hypothetical protein
MVEQLSVWFGDPYGLPIIALKGYSSQTLVADVADEILTDPRCAVLLYAGDFDPTGEDIDRDFVERVDAFAVVRRIALNADQVDEYRLPSAPGKETDSRAAAFVARHGRLLQVELDALDPDGLRGLYADAIRDHSDDDAYQESLDREDRERAALDVSEEGSRTP